LLYTLPNIVGVLKSWSCDEFRETGSGLV